MPTDWSKQTENSTNWTKTGSTTTTYGTPIGMLLGITREVTITTGGISTDWDSTTTNASRWSSTELAGGYRLLENGGKRLLESGGNRLLE